MMGLVLAAGAGRRLRPYTDTVPKTLMPVAGDATILDLALHNMAEVGVTDVAVVVGYAAVAVEALHADLEDRNGVRLTLVHNDHAEDWNNAYSLWLARKWFADGALLVNGDTVHPASVERTLLAARGAEVLLAVDDAKAVAAEEMKAAFGAAGQLSRITKLMDPADADGEYIGATLIAPAAADGLADALESTWRRDPDLYYEDGFQEYADRGGEVRAAPIGPVEWVEVDEPADLVRAREIACRY